MIALFNLDSATNYLPLEHFDKDIYIIVLDGVVLIAVNVSR